MLPLCSILHFYFALFVYERSRLQHLVKFNHYRHGITMNRSDVTDKKGVHEETFLEKSIIRKDSLC